MKLQLNFWLVLKHFLVIFLPLLALASCTTYYIQTENAKRERRIFQTNEIDLVNLQIKIIVNSFKSIKSDLIVLTGHTDMHNLLKTDDIHHKKKLAEELLLFCDTKGIYDQVRFLDEKGMEVVRVNYNTGNPYLVPEDQLQSKKDRYYFEDTFKLDKGEVFVSPFDLNVEKGKIERPLKPMIRFATTVFDSYGQKRGIMILNYLGENLINELKLASENIPGHIMLLNSNGYWLHNVKPEDEWGFMYDDRKDLVFGNTFPEAWQRISAESSGHFYNANGLFTFTTVYPLLGGWKSTDGAGGVFEKSTKELKEEEYTWKVVSYVAPDVLSTGLGGFTIILIPIYGFVIVLIGCGSWLLASSGVRRRIAEERITSFAHILDESLNEIYIFDAKTLRFIQVNEGARLNLGYSMEELSILTPLDLEPEFTTELFDKMVKLLRAGEKKKIEFTTAHRRKDGSLYDVEVHLQLSIFQSTPAFVAIILDITERKRVEEKIKVLAKFPSENPNPVLRIEKNGTILFANNAGSIFLDNWSTQTGSSVPEDWHKHVLDVLRSDKSEDYEMKCNNRIFSLTLAPVEEEGYVNFYGKDITERKKSEEQVKVSLKEKEVLLMEVHHRVKNNMQVITSLLRLQSKGIKDKQLLDLFDESRNRIKAMALIHEDLYNSKDLTSIDFNQYTRKIIGRLMASFGVSPDKITTHININIVSLSVDTAIPCGLITNELFTNSLKYAFPTNKFGVNRKDKKGEICIDFHSNSDEYTLIFSDNGVGLPEGIGFHKAETMGLELVRTLVKQLKGTIEIGKSGGARFKIIFRV